MTITDKQVMAAVLAYEVALRNGGGPLGCMRAALEAAEQAAWRTIETAQKDGEPGPRASALRGANSIDMPRIRREVLEEAAKIAEQSIKIRSITTNFAVLIPLNRHEIAAAIRALMEK